MPKATKARRVTKSEWLEAGLRALASGGILNVRIDRLARELGVARSGFYWHFRNRQDLFAQMLGHWAHELTEVITENQEIRALPPKERLLAITDLVQTYDLSRYDSAIRQWAKEDSVADEVARKTFKLRNEFIRQAFIELGFTGDDLQMRTHVFLIYTGSEADAIPEPSKAKRRRMAALRIDLLTQPGDDAR